MTSIFRELIDTLNQRVRSPVLSYAFTSLVLANWDKIFFLFGSDASAAVRIRFVEINTNFISDIFIPISLGLILCALHPWITMIFSIMTIPAIQRMRVSQIKSGHAVEIERLDSEIATAQKRAIKERDRDEALIEQAKRDKLLTQEGGAELLQEAVRLRDEEAASEGGSVSFELSNIDRKIISILGVADASLEERKIALDNGLRTITHETNPRGGVSRHAVLVKDALTNLIKRRLVASNSSGYQLTKMGFDIFDSFTR